MAGNTTLFRIDAGDVVRSLAEAHTNAGQQDGGTELLLDFSGIKRIDTTAVFSLRRIAATATARNVKLTARAVPVDVYKVLKLSGVAAGISFR